MNPTLLTATEITSWVGSFLWVLFRVAALVTSAPIFSSRSVPMKIKLGIAIAITLVITPNLPPVPSVEPFGAEAFLITLQQILIGLVMGLSLQLVFAMFVIGGQVIAYQMGLGFASMVDPQSGTQVPVVSQFYIIIVTLLFFTMNGHLMLIQSLHDSFFRMPIGTAGINLNGIWNLIEWSSQMYVGAVKIALPAIASIMLINFTFAVVTRSAPQFNIFSIGFPITMVMGFFIIMVTLFTVFPHFSQQIDSLFLLINRILS